MRDRWKIIAGLLVFLLLMTAPLWFNAIAGRSGEKPNPEIRTVGVPGRDQCVRDTDWIRAHHMDLLDEWRDRVVRKGERRTTMPDGRSFEMSLSNTCMDCHANKSSFCDPCHNYLSVDPYCWKCHIEPQEEVAVNLGTPPYSPPTDVGGEVMPTNVGAPQEGIGR